MIMPNSEHARCNLIIQLFNGFGISKHTLKYAKTIYKRQPFVGHETLYDAWGYQNWDMFLFRPFFIQMTFLNIENKYNDMRC